MDSSTLQSPQSASLAAQEAFQAQYDLDNPIAAMNSYALSMRKFTQQQMDNATRAANRRGSAHGVSAMGSLSTESSISSTNSNVSLSSQS